MKLSKQILKCHQQAIDIVKNKDILKPSEKEFVLEHYREDAVVNQNWNGTFFTSNEKAWEFALEVTDSPDSSRRERVVDLCAGIGHLAYAVKHRFPHTDLTCIEVQPQFIEVGRKVLPEATWIEANLADETFIRSLEQMNFHTAISNPPFGSISSFKEYKNKNISEAEYKVIEIASRIARRGTFILPQESAGFKYSGQRSYEENRTDKYCRFVDAAGFELEPNCGIDTSLLQGFRNAKITVEIVLANFPVNLQIQPEQLSLFEVA